MSDIECEKIIDQAIESGGTNATAEVHAKTCKKCASALALLALLKTSGSPTAGIMPSAAFIGRVENSLAKSAAGTGLIAILKPKLLAVAIGVALTLALALNIISQLKSADEHNGTAAVSSIKGQTNSADAADQNTSLNTRYNAEKFAFPKMQFPSPTDEIK